MARLFLDGIFDPNSNSPSTVTISIPVPETNSNTEITSNVLRGLIIGDPTWTAGNKWGPILSDFSNLQDWASLLGSANQFSWISASTMCWKGTSPLGIGIDFYLINYNSKKSAELKNTLSNFVKLAAVAQDTTGTSNFKVQVHGGYAPDILTGNKKFFSSFSDTSKFMKNKGAGNSELEEEVRKLFEGNTARGSLSIRFGHKSTIRNLLLSKVNVTESTIEVANQDGSNPQPLDYRVSSQFTGVQPLVTTDVDYMFSS